MNGRYEIQKRRFADARTNSYDVPSLSNRWASTEYGKHRLTTGNNQRYPQQNAGRPPTINHRQERISLRDFHSRYDLLNPEKTESSRGRRTVAAPFLHQERIEASFKDNRGVPSLQWRSGLRESKQTSVRHRISTVSLFIDNLPKGLARAWLRGLFERCGKVIDLFISTKLRPSKDVSFGFVRYGSVAEAESAINRFNGYAVRGIKLAVSMARYNRNGMPISLEVHENESPKQNTRNTNRTIASPAKRDQRLYADVVVGVKNNGPALGGVSKNDNTIPVTHSIHVKDNHEMCQLLHNAVIVENTEILDLHQIQSKMESWNVNQTGMFSLSPTKLLLVFACENDAKNAVDIDSPLWNVFDDVRMWSEGEFFDDRLVWIHCVGIHPLGWSMENLKKIGESWGPVIHVDTTVKGIQNITGARMLIRTKAQNKIDNRIKLFFENGSCDVWVKEQNSCCDECAGNRKYSVFKPPPEQVQNMEPGNSKFDFEPILQEINTWKKGKENENWVDPMILDDNIRWNNLNNYSPVQCELSPVSTPIAGRTNPRPRGRPRKSVDQGINEASKTWEIAQRLGISAGDEEAVLSGLRKSKRVWIMEGKGA